MDRTVVIDCFPESAKRYVTGHAIVAIDVIRAATTAVTAVAMGRRCFPVPSLQAARLLRRRLPEPLLVGELAGHRPPGFGLNNSPVDVGERTDIARPMILLSSSGTRLMHAARRAPAAYVACYRNAAATARHLAGVHRHVAVIGAGSRGEFREEDQICCAWIAAGLLRRGFAPADLRTQAMVERWGDAPATACVDGKSARYLRDTDQQQDLDYVLTHVNDLGRVFRLERGEIVGVGARGGKRAGSRREALAAGRI